MANLTKILLGTGIGAGVLYLLSNLLGKKKLGDRLDSITSASIHSLDLKGLTVRVDVVLKNPTEHSIRIKQPYVRVLAGDKLIGSSQVVDQVIEIKAYGATPLKDPIFIQVPLSGLLSAGKAFYQALSKNQPVTIGVDTLSSIDLGGRWIGYQKRDLIPLKPKLQPKTK